MIGTVCFLLAMAAPAPTAPEAIALIERAVITGDEEYLRKAHGESLAHLQNPGAEIGMEPYTLAYISWQLAHVLGEDAETKKERLELLVAAEQRLRQLLESRPHDPEVHALLGSVIGEQIGNSAWKGMRLGPKASKALKKAVALGPDNPRVALQQGIGHLFTPKLFGGGLVKAERELQRAADLFRKEPLEAPWPNWGHVAAHVWLGQLYTKKRDYDQAQVQYETVLSFEPDHHWVRDVLLPELKDKRK